MARDHHFGDKMVPKNFPHYSESSLLDPFLQPRRPSICVITRISARAITLGHLYPSVTSKVIQRAFLGRRSAEPAVTVLCFLFQINIAPSGVVRAPSKTKKGQAPFRITPNPPAWPAKPNADTLGFSGYRTGVLP